MIGKQLPEEVGNHLQCQSEIRPMKERYDLWLICGTDELTYGCSTTFTTGIKSFTTMTITSKIMIHATIPSVSRRSGE